MTSIPASAIVSVTPSVLPAGGRALDIIGLLRTRCQLPGSLAEPPIVAWYAGAAMARRQQPERTTRLLSAATAIPLPVLPATNANVLFRLAAKVRGAGTRIERDGRRRSSFTMSLSLRPRSATKSVYMPPHPMVILSVR